MIHNISCFWLRLDIFTRMPFYSSLNPFVFGSIWQKQLLLLAIVASTSAMYLITTTEDDDYLRKVNWNWKSPLANFISKRDSPVVESLDYKGTADDYFDRMDNNDDSEDDLGPINENINSFVDENGMLSNDKTADDLSQINSFNDYDDSEDDTFNDRD